MPLYPTEKIIWDENIVPTEYYSGEGACPSQCTFRDPRPLQCTVESERFIQTQYFFLNRVTVKRDGNLGMASMR